MKIKNLKLSREAKQTIQGAKLLSVTVHSGNIIAAVEDGKNDIELLIVTDEVPDNASYIATLNEGNMISHIYISSSEIKNAEE